MKSCKCVVSHSQICGEAWRIFRVCGAHVPPSPEEFAHHVKVMDKDSHVTMAELEKSLIAGTSGVKARFMGSVRYTNRTIYLNSAAGDRALGHELGHVLAWYLGIENTEAVANLIQCFVVDTRDLKE
jgi:hypothetical protein